MIVFYGMNIVPMTVPVFRLISLSMFNVGNMISLAYQRSQMVINVKMTEVLMDLLAWGMKHL